MTPYRVCAIDFAHIHADESVLFYNGDPERSREIGCFSWLLTRDSEHILIDTGIADLSTVNETVQSSDRWKGVSSLEEGLAAEGLTPEDIDTVIITHGHYDHISNLPRLTSARILISRQEWEDLMSDDDLSDGILGESRIFLRTREKEGRVFFVDKCLVLNSEILIRYAGGHTRGSQMVFADTELGKCLFTGDAVFLLENIRRGIPIGLTADREQSINMLKICSQFDGLILTSHDLEATNKLI